VNPVALVGGVAISTCILAPALADDQPLPALNADIKETSISGISSGAFMAVQFATAYSSIVKGVASIAGGPFGCALGDKAIPDQLKNITMMMSAVFNCMQDMAAPDVPTLISLAERLANEGAIDPLDNLVRQKMYVFHGYNDKVVLGPVSDATVAFYRHWLVDMASGNLFYQNTIGAGHSLVTTDFGGDCNANADPFLDQCGYDQAGIILQHFYGALQPPAGTLAGQRLRFDQGLYSHLRRSPETDNLSDDGFVYVPADCAPPKLAVCRVHVALHGCQQNVASVGDKFIEHAGYNRWADKNHIIVLYPQAKATLPGMTSLVTNPLGCWDLWGYHDWNETYLTHSGRQIEAIHKMLEALTAGYKPQPAPAPSHAAPAELVVTDVSDMAAALAWEPVAGATEYRLYRHPGADGTFEQVGTTLAPGYGDAGLAPASAYTWQVTAVVDGVESAPSATAVGRTRGTPAPCADPGTCKVAAEN